MKDILEKLLSELDKSPKKSDEKKILGYLNLLMSEIEEKEIPAEVLELFNTNDRRKVLLASFIGFMGLLVNQK